MGTYESTDLAKIARQVFREAYCGACRMDNQAPRSRRLHGWRVCINGESATVMGYGTCRNGHEIAGYSTI